MNRHEEQTTLIIKIKDRYSTYSVGAIEKKTLRVVRRGTKRDVTRSRKLLEDRRMPWTRIEWGDDGQPNYIHDVREFPAPPWSSK